ERGRTGVAVLLEVGGEREHLAVRGEDRVEDLEPSGARVAATTVAEDRDRRSGVVGRLVAARGQTLADGRSQDDVPEDRPTQGEVYILRTVGRSRELAHVAGEQLVPAVPDVVAGLAIEEEERRRVRSPADAEDTAQKKGRQDAPGPVG